MLSELLRSDLADGSGRERLGDHCPVRKERQESASCWRHNHGTWGIFLLPRGTKVLQV